MGKCNSVTGLIEIKDRTDWSNDPWSVVCRVTGQPLFISDSLLCDTYPVPKTAVPARPSDVSALNFPSAVLLTRTVSLSTYSPHLLTASAAPMNAARWKKFIMQKLHEIARKFENLFTWRSVKLILGELFQIQCSITFQETLKNHIAEISSDLFIELSNRLDYLAFKFRGKFLFAT